MPLVESKYIAPVGFRSGHVQTCYPTLFRTVPEVNYQRERLELSDGDFVDLDWNQASASNYNQIAILAHGLEGSGDRKYMRGMSHALNEIGWTALAWNMRGCSGEPNRTSKTYHSGRTDDLSEIITHVKTTKNPIKIALIGFSLGGNVVLKYLGEEGSKAENLISSAIAFSVPCDLAAGAKELVKAENSLYHRRFMRDLKQKVIDKQRKYAQFSNSSLLEKVRTIIDFDECFTAPLNGFRSAQDYWQQSSSLQFIPNIKVPTLLLSALDDPLLDASCFPTHECKTNPHFFLETPAHGGHCGFVTKGGLYWSEKCAIEFLLQHADVLWAKRL